jgi:hypothetical protein
LPDQAATLQQTRDEEVETDRELTGIAETSIYVEAMG